MAAANLYPPIVQTTMPTFINTETCKVYFSISAYNSLSDIANAQVVVNSQSNNSSVLSATLYPSGIKIIDVGEIYTDNSVEGDAKYYIKIDASDLSLGEFEVNSYYKVQIRFTSDAAAAVSGSTGIASWLTNNQDYFSEWSTVCLIRGISQPDFSFTGMSTESTSPSKLTSTIVHFTGTMSFEDSTEKEYLVSYNIQIYEGEGTAGTLVTESGIQYTDDYNPNEINYVLNYILENQVLYTAHIVYTTNGGYSSYVDFYFQPYQTIEGDIDAEFNITADPDNGRNIVSVEGTFYGTILLKRASSETGFTVWETVDDGVSITSSYESETGFTVYVSGSSLIIDGADSVSVEVSETPSVYTSAMKTRVVKVVDDELVASATDDTLTLGVKIIYTFYDYTIESGVYYKYAIQLLSEDDVYSNVLTSDRVINLLDDMFLTRADMQLRVRYDPGVSSFKHTYSESMTTTIGSQYPYIRRNGAVNYRQFPITGLITGFCDDEGIFLSKDVIYGDDASYYEEFNEDNKITEVNDFIYERKFREKVMDFLYGNNIKLFRSTTEGNILVRLMDVSFTPNQTLGRMLYSFSATAYEIADCSVENYQTYGIL